MEHAIVTFLIYAIPVVFAITVHEVAHGYVARLLGDTTAWRAGRLTLNPLKHVDPFGTIVLPLLLYLSTGGRFLFGYAKPVPVNFAALRNPRRDSVWVALAGPLSNLLQALLWGLLAVLFDPAPDGVLTAMCRAGIFVNVIMCVFNLFPLPPLDGGRVVAGLLPPRLAAQYGRVEPYGMWIVMGLLVLESTSGVSLLGRLWMEPLMHAAISVLQTLLGPLNAWLHP